MISLRVFFPSLNYYRMMEPQEAYSILMKLHVQFHAKKPEPRMQMACQSGHMMKLN